MYYKNILVLMALVVFTSGCEKSHSHVTIPKWAMRMGNDRYGTYADMMTNGIISRFRWISSGSFRMGCSDGEKLGAETDELRHLVKLTRGYWLEECDCSQALWQAIMGSNQSYFNGEPQSPMDQVSWYDCQGFLRKLESLIPGLQARLPTEAEWEYACRAGTTDSFQGKKLDSVAWYSENSGSTTHPIMLKSPNAWGLFDMLGNVRQWCADWYGPYAVNEGVGEIENPTGVSISKRHVCRGGDWDKSASSCQSSSRSWALPNIHDNSIGFRICIADSSELEIK
jgi:sulfatase modifying factor 1